ncbi:hypothetical protein SAMN05421825_3693 [Epilithonimonas hungarica]|uniref:Uncharacterized protein n=2 Tax=Epilithonimonas hungarica TaxID=454006 RepID=A0A1G7VND2_9FLAO|nr:hypothetical protein SAMN05421825_3693 [Epilithonimonas hungarica]
MKKGFFVTAVVAANFIFGQVGINNEDPKATLDVTAKTTDGTKPEGFIAPRLSGEEIKGKDAKYLAEQKGTIIYATSASSDAGVSGAKTINIAAEGYYYFDGSIWQKFNSGTAVASGTEPWYNVATNTGATANTQDIYQMGKVGVGTNTPGATLDIVSAGSDNTTKALKINNSAATPQEMVTVLNNGNVGLGRVNPTDHLHLGYGNARIEYDPALVDNGIKLSGTGGLYHRLPSHLGITGTTNRYVSVNSNSLGVALETDNSDPTKNGLLILRTGTGNVGINEPNPTTTLHVKAKDGVGTGFRLVDGSQGTNKILTSDIDGNASWKDATASIIINSTPGVTTNLNLTDDAGGNGTNMTYTGASAVVTVPGYYFITTKYIGDKAPFGCSTILALNLNKNSSTVFNRSTAAFPTQDIHTVPGNGRFDYFFTTQIAYLDAATYYMFARTQGTAPTCTSYSVRAGIDNNSFTLTLLK